MKQTKLESLIEAAVNTFIGFLITCAIAPLLYWTVHVKMNAVQMGMANLLFTIVSVIRNYLIRRWFNGKIFKINVQSRSHSRKPKHPWPEDHNLSHYISQVHPR